jgi:hypothetical protein
VRIRKATIHALDGLGSTTERRVPRAVEFAIWNHRFETFAISEDLLSSTHRTEPELPGHETVVWNPINVPSSDRDRSLDAVRLHHSNLKSGRFVRWLARFEVALFE